MRKKKRNIFVNQKLNVSLIHSHRRHAQRPKCLKIMTAVEFPSSLLKIKNTMQIVKFNGWLRPNFFHTKDHTRRSESNASRRQNYDAWKNEMTNDKSNNGADYILVVVRQNHFIEKESFESCAEKNKNLVTFDCTWMSTAWQFWYCMTIITSDISNSLLVFNAFVFIDRTSSLFLLLKPCSLRLNN